MSHDSGFRRADHDATHALRGRRRDQHSKASAQFEERLRRRAEESERLRRLLESKREDD